MCIGAWVTDQGEDAMCCGSSAMLQWMQAEQTGFGSSVRIINMDTNTALRSCGMDEVVRDTVLADSSPAARWNLVACEDNWFACRPASDDTEVWGLNYHQRTGQDKVLC